MKSLSRSALLIAVSFAAAMLGSFAFIGVASHDLADVEFAEVAFVWLTVGAAPSMLALGNHLLLQRFAARSGGVVTRRQLSEALVWPLGLLGVIAIVTAAATVGTGNRYATLTFTLVPALTLEVVRTVAGEAARVVVGPVRSIVSGGQVRVVLTAFTLFVIRALGASWTPVVLIVTMSITSLVLATVAVRQCRLSVVSSPRAEPAIHASDVVPGRRRQMAALAAVSAVGVVFARTPIWAAAVVSPGVVDEIAIGLTFFTLFSQPQAITNLALTAEIADAAHSSDRSRLRRIFGVAMGVNSCLAVAMLTVLAVFGSVGLQTYAGDRADGLLGVVVMFALAGSIVSVSGPGALILQFEGRDRALVRLAVPSMLLAIILFPALATLDSALAIGLGLLLVTVPYNFAASWIALNSVGTSVGDDAQVSQGGDAVGRRPRR